MRVWLPRLFLHAGLYRVDIVVEFSPLIPVAFQQKQKQKKHSSTSISYTPPRFSFLGSLVLCRKRKTFRILSSYFSSSQKFILLCVWAISSIRNCKTRSDFSFQKLSLNVPLFPNFLPLRFFLFCFLVSISSHFKFLRVAFQIIICRANVKCPCRVDVPVDFR